MSTFQPNRGSDLHQHVRVFTAEPARLVGRGGCGCGGGGAVGTDGGGLGNALAALRKQELDHLARLATQGNRQARATRGRCDRGEPVGRHGLWPAGAPPAPSASVSTRQHTNQRPSSRPPASARHAPRQQRAHSSRAPRAAHGTTHTDQHVRPPAWITVDSPQRLEQSRAGWDGTGWVRLG